MKSSSLTSGPESAICRGEVTQVDITHGLFSSGGGA